MEIDRKIKKVISVYMEAPSREAADAVFYLSSQRAAMMRPKPQWRPAKPKPIAR